MPTLDELRNQLSAFQDSQARKVHLYRTVVDELGFPTSRIYRGSFMLAPGDDPTKFEPSDAPTKKPIMDD